MHRNIHILLTICPLPQVLDGTVTKWGGVVLADPDKTVLLNGRACNHDQQVRSAHAEKARVLHVQP